MTKTPPIRHGGSRRAGPIKDQLRRRFGRAGCSPDSPHLVQPIQCRFPSGRMNNWKRKPKQPRQRLVDSAGAVLRIVASMSTADA
jgi:hypothetical protein